MTLWIFHALTGHLLYVLLGCDLCHLNLFVGIVVIGGCAFYAIKPETKNLGYSYLLCISGGGGAILAGLLLCLDRRRDSQSDTEVVYTQQVCTSITFYSYLRVWMAIYSRPKGP